MKLLVQCSLCVRCRWLSVVQRKSLLAHSEGHLPLWSRLMVCELLLWWLCILLFEKY